MSLRDLSIKSAYFSPRDDIVADFFIPVLKESIQYDRGTGFFTSAALVELSRGIMGVICNGGHIRMITSPRFTDDDWETIKSGYDIKQRMSEAMIRELKIEDEDYLDNIILLSKLIISGRLDIRVAIMKDQELESMFHAKFGTMVDSDGNSIAFTGSVNDSYLGLRRNGEMISVVERHFSPDDDNEHLIQNNFNILWDGKDPTVMVYELPDDVVDKFHNYSCLNFTEGFIDLDTGEFLNCQKSVFFSRPNSIVPKDYQKNAVKEWVSRGYNGMYNMATGTGKTIAAMLSLERLYNDLGGGLFTIIVCPQKHLVDQWTEIVKSFGVYPIVGYSDYKISDWKSRFTSIILSASEKTNCCLITTINSFCMDDTQKWISRIKKLVLIVDEVHNMGSKNRLAKLPPNALYRLGLSATIDRYKDPVGTAKLREYFGEECINLPISEAIGKVLTNYYYHPHVCYFSEEEFSQFQGINSEIERIQGNPSLTQKRRQSLIREQQLKGILLISRLKSKFESLEQIVSEMVNEDHILIYCGRTRFKDDDEDDDKELQAIGVRIVDKVVEMLGIGGTSNLDIKLSQFTYMEKPEERRNILQSFQAGDIQALVAISCLDEGVDIPSIRTAIITSSSENPKEYVQRRGRVLRRYPGKEFAVVYDLVAIPRNLDSRNDSRYSADLEMKLLCREVSRIQEFAKDSINPEESQELLDRISNSYGESIEDMLDCYWR